MNGNRIAVLGIGNVIMQDEGIGVHVVKHLEEAYRFEPQINIIDGGTSGAELLSFFDDHDRMIIVDAVEFEKEPGFIGTIEHDDILRRLTTKMSMHHLGLTDVLSNAKLLDIEPEEIFLVGMQPKSMEITMDLSEIATEQMPQVVHAVLDKLESWGVKSTLLSDQF